MPGGTSAAALPPPDFAIVGARKCGTTALYSYLATHPDIAMSARKEPCFWSRDLDAGWGIRDRAAYDAMWADAPPGALRGEASPVYLQSRVAIPELLAARPDVRLIAMIRNPVEMVVSRHANLLLDRDEDVADLETAWRLQERRLRGEVLPARCPWPEVFQYRTYASIGDHLERFMDLVPAEQRLVIVYDDFRADTRREYLRALALLGLADDGRTDFAPVREGHELYWQGLPDWQRRLSRLTWLYRPARALAHAMGFSPAAANRHPPRRRPLRPEFEQELADAFLPQVKKLERLLGRDFAAWKVAR